MYVFPLSPWLEQPLTTADSVLVLERGVFSEITPPRRLPAALTIGQKIRAA